MPKKKYIFATTHMENIDYILIIPLILGFVFGISRGFIREIFSILGIFAGIWGGKILTPAVSDFLSNHLSMNHYATKPLAFVLLFLAIFMLFLILNRFLEKLVQSVALGGLNKLMGGVLGLVKYAIIVSLVLNIFHAVNLRVEILGASKIESSSLYKPMLNFGPQLWNELKPVEKQ